MKETFYLIVVCNLILFSCCGIKRNNLSENVNISEKLQGYWISSDSNYMGYNNSSNKTTVYFGPISRENEGKYLQDDKEFVYRIIKTDELNKQVEIAIRFSGNRERFETLTFSENYTRIKNNLLTPDGFSIDTYYTKK